MKQTRKATRAWLRIAMLSTLLALTISSLLPAAGATDTNSNTSVSVSAPVSIAYTLNNPTDGYAAGTLSVTVPPEATTGYSAIPYWADNDGILVGYTSLSKFKITGETTDFVFGKHVLIPADATHIRVYLQRNADGALSADFAEIALPEGAAHPAMGEPTAELWVVSDIHVTDNGSHTYNQNFSNMLRDTVKTSPNALGIFVVGDITNGGIAAEYALMKEAYDLTLGAAPLFLATGNHDHFGLPYDQACELFLEYAMLPDGSHPTDTSYDFWLEGYHFVFLGTDANSGNNALFTKSSMEWLRETLAENRDEARPTFLFLHQSMNNTVSGSLPGEGWSGVSNEKLLHNVLKDYPEVMLFNGHSHWTMDSPGNMYEGDDSLPCRIFNCASVAYLWSGYNVVTGEHLDGSQGYLVRLYDGKLYVLGRDFIREEWIPAAQYCVVLEEIDAEETTTATEPGTTATSESETAPQGKGGCGSAISATSLVVIASAIPALWMRKRRED